MKKNLDTPPDPISEADDTEMLPEYSFKGGQRGRYAHLFPQKPGVVVLSPDMAAVFPDSDTVNEALRALVKAAQNSIHSSRPSDRKAA